MLLIPRIEECMVESIDKSGIKIEKWSVRPGRNKIEWFQAQY
jgi:hypothetical protein